MSKARDMLRMVKRLRKAAQQLDPNVAQQGREWFSGICSGVFKYAPNTQIVDFNLKKGLGNTKTAFQVYVCLKCADLFTSWPEFSGDPVYPVPDEDGNHYMYYHRCWSNRWTGKQLQQRLSLLDHMVSELERELEGTAL